MFDTIFALFLLFLVLKIATYLKYNKIARKKWEAVPARRDPISQYLKVKMSTCACSSAGGSERRKCMKKSHI